MQTIKYNYNNKTIDIVNGKFNIVSDADALVQLIKCKLKTFKGEWFLDTTLGVDYYNIIFNKNVSEFVKFTEFKTAILNIEGITNVINFYLAEADKKGNYTLTFDILSIYGTISITEEL